MPQINNLITKSFTVATAESPKDITVRDASYEGEIFAFRPGWVQMGCAASAQWGTWDGSSFTAVSDCPTVMLRPSVPVFFGYEREFKTAAGEDLVLRVTLADEVPAGDPARDYVGYVDLQVIGGTAP